MRYMSEMSFPAEPQDNSRAAEKVRDFPNRRASTS